MARKGYQMVRYAGDFVRLRRRRGADLARGYVKRRALSAKRFVADSYGAPGTRVTAPGTWPRDALRGCWSSLAGPTSSSRSGAFVARLEPVAINTAKFDLSLSLSERRAPDGRPEGI